MDVDEVVSEVEADANVVSVIVVGVDTARFVKLVDFFFLVCCFDFTLQVFWSVEFTWNTENNAAFSAFATETSA